MWPPQVQNMLEWLAGALAFLLGLMAAALLLAIILLVVGYRRLRRIDLPTDADFFSTIRAVPLYLAVALDLLDFSLDFLAAPISWILLGHLNLNGLRNVTTIEMLIPFTQPIPTLTLNWIAARVFDLGKPRVPIRKLSA